MKPALALLALFATSLAAAQMTAVPNVVRIPPPGDAAPAQTVVPPRAGVTEALAIDPQIADLRHELSLLRREVASQQQEIATLKACAADLAASARGPGFARMEAPDLASMQGAPATQGTLAATLTAAQPPPKPRPKPFADCG